MPLQPCLRVHPKTPRSHRRDAGATPVSGRALGHLQDENRRCVRPGPLPALIAAALVAILVGPGRADIGAGGLTSAQKNQLPRHFGFGPLEIVKIDHGITQLRTADFNNDGAADLAVANNGKSTIEVLLQRLGKPDEPEKPEGTNDLVSHWRFERKKVSVTWRVACLKAADVTGDGNADLVFFGDPKELVVLPGRGDGTFKDAITRRLRDGLALAAGLEVADMNGDQRLDVVLLAESDVLIFPQPEKGGGLGKPKRFAHALESPLALKTEDLDGDGRTDVILLTHDEDYPLHVRFQDATGELGPVQRMKLPGLRSLMFAPCLGRRQVDLFGVEGVSGRLKRWSLDAGDDAPADGDWRVLFYPLPGKSDVERLPLAIGDVNGDQRPDVISANVDAAQLVLFTQQAKVGLGQPESFGGQVKMLDMRCLDGDGDGADEVYVLSSEEDTIARSLFSDKRLGFPKALPTLGKPYALDVGPPKAGSEPHVAYVSKNRKGDYQLVVQAVAATSTETAANSAVTLEDVDEPPVGVRWVDANRDGLEDVLIFASYGPLLAVLQQPDGTFKPLGENGSPQTGLVKNATVPGFDYADTDGDGIGEVLLAQKAFVRALRVNDKGSWEIIDQYNAPTSDADVTGLCVVPRVGSASPTAEAADPPRRRPSLAMYDRKGREVHFFTPVHGGTYSVDRSVRVGAFDLKAMYAAPLGGTRVHSVLLADKGRLALVLPGTPASRVGEKGVYESSIKNARLTQVAAGDLNHDGITDLAVIDTHDHFVEILTFAPDHSLVRANKFRVFSKKQYRSSEHESTEPRWITIRDVTHDGRDDLILIAHDRILLYPGQ